MQRYLLGSKKISIYIICFYFVFYAIFLFSCKKSENTFRSKQLVEKSRCILPLPNLFPSLARCFACCQSCSVSLRTLWAYGFDSAARRALQKSKVGEKEKNFFPFNQLYFLKKAINRLVKLKGAFSLFHLLNAKNP